MAVDEQKAREILGDDIQPDGSLYCLGRYLAWSHGDDTVTLDAKFSADELEAIAYWMRRSSHNTADAQST